MDDVFKNTQKLAKEIESLAGTNTKLYLRPYNRFKPDNTMWWLVPSKEYPAYKYGKLFFEMGDDNMFCGYYLEKGVNTKDDSYCTSLQITKEWIWYEFMEKLVKEDEKLFDILKKLASRRLESYVVISIGIVPPSKYEDSESAEDFKKDFNPSRIEFEIDESMNLFFQEKKAKINRKQDNIAKFISELKNETSLSKLVSRFNSEEFSELDWSWIDMYFGTYLNQSDLNISELWRKYLRGWEPWLRKHEN